jgi:hypothetical protein
MTRQEALQSFYDTYVKPACAEQLEGLERYYNTYKDDLAEAFNQSFRRICINIREKQSSGEKGKIGYITYSMRRTYMLEKKYEHPIHAYDRDWFFDNQPCHAAYDSSWIFGRLEQLESELKIKSRLYMNKILVPDVEQIKLQKAADFNRYVTCLGQYAMPLAVQLPEFQDIACEDDLEVYAGEYKGMMDLIYKKSNEQAKVEPLRYREIL